MFAMRFGTVALALTLLSGCYETHMGHAPNGFGTFGSRGGTLYAPDGNFTLEVERGGLDDATDLVVGAVDECLPDEIACYELEPAGLDVGEATVTLDVSSMVEDDYRDAAVPLLVFVEEYWGWRLAKVSDTDADTIAIPLTELGSVSVVPGTRV